MAKSSGMGMTIAVDDSSGTVRSISNDFLTADFGTPRGVQDITGINSSAMERLLLLADFSISLNGVFNPASNTAHDVFKTVSSTSVNRTVTITVSAKVLANETLFTDYQLKRAANGSFMFTAPGALADGAVPTWT